MEVFYCSPLLHKVLDQKDVGVWVYRTWGKTKLGELFRPLRSWVFPILVLLPSSAHLISSHWQRKKFALKFQANKQVIRIPKKGYTVLNVKKKNIYGIIFFFANVSHRGIMWCALERNLKTQICSTFHMYQHTLFKLQHTGLFAEN